MNAGNWSVEGAGLMKWVNALTVSGHNILLKHLSMYCAQTLPLNRNHGVSDSNSGI
jgi:hypothetical protein